MEKTYYIVTFGCQMNIHDEERIRGALEAEGWRECGRDEASAAVFLTCCVRGSAEERFYGRLSALSGVKDKRGLIIAVGGCVAQKEGPGLMSRFPCVDVVFGTQQYVNIASMLDGALEGKICSTAMDGFNISGITCRRREGFRAWVTITQGCDNFCSYCIVPYVRGSEYSRPLEEVEEEVGAHVASGAVEINLLGQNVDSYRSKEEGRSRLADLLYVVAERYPDTWIRFTTSHPRDFDSGIMRAIADNANVCEYVHLPLQSGSDSILAAMRRGYSRKDYLRKVEELRRVVPGVSIGTDLIVGFPGEREEDFRETLEMVEMCRFDSAFTFIYNAREGTSAARLQDDVPRPLKQERMERLMELTRRLTRESLSSEIDARHTVLVHGPSRKDPSRWSARTRSNRIVHFERGTSDLTGRFVDVRITGAASWSLAAVPET